MRRRSQIKQISAAGFMSQTDGVHEYPMEKSSQGVLPAGIPLAGRGRDCIATTVPSLRDSTLFHFATPGTDVPGFPVSPLRGWRNGAVHFFCGPWGCDTELGDARLPAGIPLAGRGRPALHYMIHIHA